MVSWRHFVERLISKNPQALDGVMVRFVRNVGGNDLIIRVVRVDTLGTKYPHNVIRYVRYDYYGEVTSSSPWNLKDTQYELLSIARDIHGRILIRVRNTS